VFNAFGFEEIYDLLLGHCGNVDNSFLFDALLSLYIMVVCIDVQRESIIGNHEFDARVTAKVVHREVRVIGRFLVDKGFYLRKPV
jgi:hypothetical protein